MLRFHTVVITADANLKQAARRLLPAIGASCDLLDTEAGLPEARTANLILFDARQRVPSSALTAGAHQGAAVVYFIEPGSLPDRLGLYDEDATASLICLPADGELDEAELIATATKLLRKDPFGLHKHFPWGVTLYTMEVRSFAEKERALQVISEYAMTAGCRGPLRDRISAVADELMMNALFRAKVDADGNQVYKNLSADDLANLEEQDPIQVQYGTSGKDLAVAVRDGRGSLLKNNLLLFLNRVRTGAPSETKPSGAGLGLVSVLRASSRLIFNLSPGSSSEVIALFDRQSTSPAPVGARSLHILSVDPEPEAEAVSADEEEFSDLGEVVSHRPSTRRILAASLLVGMLAFCGSLLVLHLTHRIDLYRLLGRLPSVSASRTH